MALVEDISFETAENWKERTEGWVTGLQLAVHTLADSNDNQEKTSNSDGTVKTHLQHLYRKLSVTDRRDATVKAKQLGLLR